MEAHGLATCGPADRQLVRPFAPPQASGLGGVSKKAVKLYPKIGV